MRTIGAKMRPLFRGILLALGAIIPISAYGATDGTVGATSTGTSTVSLTIPEYVIVRNMNDFAFGNWNGTSALDTNDDIAISGNDDQGTPSYQVTLSGSGASSAFTIARTSPASPAATIAYTVAFNDQTGTSGGVAATATTAITNQTGINQALSTTTTNANIRVQIALATLQAAPYGTYSGTLTIVVQPE
jgi:hypothetical protein